MTYAELLRKHATDATNEGGMWFSGEYMTMLASMAESIEAENAKLRELARHLRECTRRNSCAECEYADDACDFDYDMRELGIEYEER